MTLPGVRRAVQRFLDPPCRLPCPACREHTRAYLHYLVRAGELTGKRLLTLHNLTFMRRLMLAMQEAIAAGEYQDFARRVLEGAAPNARAAG